ncbi:hypothetical protein GALMADRAFT_252180 [Galerina marginata CBS 339.88]|uniref:Transmembrane protein n=1 Tax=Galerina marginata (strain CBS 339.88) TaxID=685588 RepID=A0A067T1G6_GALM3|nr:hypothetical protein GALMADRAFT_252180 [Galerina marginata CBS 339.88]
MLDNSAMLVPLGLLAFSFLPSAIAGPLSWMSCSKDAQGQEVCKDKVARGTRIAVALACFFVLVLLATLAVCIVRNRRASATSEKEYNVEASQVDGPPTIIATSYDPTSGPSPVYSANMNGHQEGRLSPQPPMTGPMYPATSYNNNPYYANQQTYTAPVSQVTFPNQPYPFSPGVGPAPPKTAFVSSGFPRPLLAGDRLKDRIKERPASISSLTPTLPAYK